MITTLLLCLVALYIIYRARQYYKGYLLYKNYVKDGVPFVSGYNFFTDLRKMKRYSNPVEYLMDNFGDSSGNMPPVLGITYMGQPVVYFNTFESLQDLYIN